MVLELGYFVLLTLFGPAYKSVSRNQGGHIVTPPSLNILGLGGVSVPILFGIDLLWNDLPFSKEFRKFGCLQPSKIMFEFWNFWLAQDAFDPVCNEYLWNSGISDELFFFGETRYLYGQIGLRDKIRKDTNSL